MRKARRRRSVVSVIVGLSLLLQMLAPIWSLTPSVSAAPLPAPATALNALASDSTEPSILAQPISVSRVQSQFADAGAPVEITYTVRNNLSPKQPLDVPDDATIEEKIAALAAYDVTADPHTLRNVILVVSSTAESEIVAASHPADVDGGTHVFILGNLPPQASATIVVTAATPASVSAPTPLVNATGWASLNGEAHSATSAPALIFPAALGDWLMPTIDANSEDAEMLQALAQIDSDPELIFAFVRGLDYEAYRGSLRGTRGTLWAEAGNSLDLSSLLIAMLRASGVPARYRHGRLSEANAQTLIASMFPTPTTILGRVSPELPVSDPVNDPSLIAIVRDHWWVEAHIGGSWTDLDPSFAGASVGDVFASEIATDGTDRIAELTDDHRHLVTLRLDIETYNQLNLGGQPIRNTYLDHTFRVVEVATSSVTFANHVTSEGQGGLVYANTIHTYAPFLYIEDLDQIFWGESYQELLTNFPLATTFITGAWLSFEITDLDGVVTTYERTLRDRLGYDMRTYGGTPDIAIDGGSPGIFSEFDIYSISLFPGTVPTNVYETRRASMTGTLSQLATDAQRMQELVDLEPLSIELQTEAAQLRARYQLNLSFFLNAISMSFAEAAGRASRSTQDALYVKAYHNSPRLIIVSHEISDNVAQLNVDLRTTLERTIAYPGQGVPATFAFNLFKGINESWLEGEVLDAVAGAQVQTTAVVMQAAHDQGIPFVYISKVNLDLLPDLDLTAEAMARITRAVLDGKLVNLPTAAPLINGEPAMGWWEIDPNTGETIGVMENGLHSALVEYVGNLLFGTTVGRIADFMIGATAATYDFLGKQVFKATGSGDFGTPAQDALGTSGQGISCLMADALGCLGIGKGYLDYGYMAMEALLNYLDTNDPPLPDLLIGNTVMSSPQTSADTVLTIPATLSGSSIAADVESAFVQIEEADGGLSFYAGALERLASGSSGQKTAINHVDSASLTPAAARLQIPAPVGTVTIAGVSIDAGRGVALADFSGTMNVATVNPGTDRIVLNGAGQLFTLAASPEASSISPVETATFDVLLTSTFADDFTTTLFAPEGWDVDIDTAGGVTATPPSGAAPGAYTLTLTAQSETYPSLILTAEHTVTVTGYDGLTLTVTQDLLTTVPMGERQDDRSFINTGQAQVPGAAYIIELTNTANVGRTYTVSVTGLPDGWTLLGGVQGSSITLALPPGTASQIGLYVTPPHLPAAGTSYTIDVVATAENGSSASDSVNFVMPEVAFSYVQVTPSTRATTATGSVVYDVTVSNVGNASGEFSLNAEVMNFDESISFGPLPDPVNLLPEEMMVFPFTVSAESAPIFRKVQLEFSSPVPDTPYAPTANAELRIVSAQAEPILNGVDLCEFPAGLQAAAYSVATAVDELVYWCQQGDCPLPLRDQVVTVGQSFVLYARSSAGSVGNVPGIPVVEAALAALSTQTTHTGILDAVTDLGTSIYDLSGELCQIQQHRVSARFSPYAVAILLGDTASFDLDVTNRGTVTTTYAITVTGLPGGSINFNEIIDPGARTRLEVSATPAALGSTNLEAEIVAIGPDVTLDIRRQISARLNVVDKFVQVTSVTADPPFVETGTSATTISVQVANLAGVAQTAHATLSVLTPDATPQFSAGIPLSILAGAPRSYELVSINTSGWAAGIYTITVQLLNDQGALIPDGSGFGYLSVGQAVQFSQAVIPTIVAPGTVTVTTRITTELSTQFLPSADPEISSTELSRRSTLYDAPNWEVEQAERSGGSPQITVNTEHTVTGLALPLSSTGEVEETPLGPTGKEIGDSPLSFHHTAPPTTPDAAFSVSTDEVVSSLPQLSQVAFAGFTRTEQDDTEITYTGTWSNHTTNRASGGSYWRNATAGSSAAFTFEGEWLNIGFMGSRWGGFVEIAINSVSQGTFDLYRREDNTPLSLVFDDLGAGPHTLTVTVTGSSNPFSSGTRVELDYIDVRDGTPLVNGTFEQSDVRVLRSTGWITVTSGNASGGSYGRGFGLTAWFPFDGDSFTYQAMVFNGANKTRLYVDGHYLDTVDLYHPNSIGNAVTRTFSYAGFGPGRHILQISAYRGQTTLDALTTPGEAPFIYPTPTPGSINRYEEDHPAIRYNGAPYTQTAQSWVRTDDGRASDGQVIYSPTAGDTISFDFEGSWAHLGFYADRFGGYAEVFLNGESQAVVDLYRREPMLVSLFYPDLIHGSHTITIAVLGDGNAYASGNRVYLDFIEFGDGTGLDHGTFEETDERVVLSTPWIVVSDDNASGGSFIRTGNQSAWFHFEGDSFTYQAMAYNLANKTHLYIDGQYLDTVDLFHPNTLANAITRTFSYAGFGPGPHVLQISAYRGQTTLDTITTPGEAPFMDPNPPVVAITRFEEDHLAIRYNGVPHPQTAQSWNRVDSISSTRASDGQVLYSATAGDTISFDFEGPWIGVGFATDRFSGQAEIDIDGTVVAEIDLYSRDSDTESFYFNNLGASSHTITITVLGTRHPNASNSRVHLDYFDVWDGQPLSEGTFEETNERIFYSHGWSRVVNAEASGGGFAATGSSDGTAWFPFTGDSVTMQAWTASGYHSLELKIDGVSLGHFNTYSFQAGPRAFSFEGLGDGPHVLEVRRYRNSAAVDAFITPATGEHYELPTPSGVIRLEEDHPDLRFNGYPLRTMPQSWSVESSLFNSSGQYHVRTSTAGNTMSLVFEGTWVGVGFHSTSWSGVAEVFIDGISRGTVDTAGFAGGIMSVYYDDLPAGSHVISVTAVSGTVMPDFIDIWDGQTLADGWYNATLDDYSGRFHFSNKWYWGQYENIYAYEGDFVRQNLINANPNIWLTFVGSDLTLLTRNGNNAILDITIDGVSYGEFNLTAEFSNQPLALHFPELGDGPHVVQIHTRAFGIVDAFEINPDVMYAYTPEITWWDASGKEQLDSATGTGFLTTIAIGDLNGDGNVELVAPGVNGRLYVYRGDGQDTGDGTPILWTSDLVGPAAEPALADLTGDGLAEIIVSGRNGTFAFRHDGTLLWENPDVVSYFAGEDLGWGGPTVANLDDDPYPEIVIAASEDALYVLDHTGAVEWSDPIGIWPTVPVLADVTGDGRLNIIVAQRWELRVYDYHSGAGELAWTYVKTDTTNYVRPGVFGAPAVADLTGDGRPEIIINWGHIIEAFRYDGTSLWRYHTNDTRLYRPSAITVADVTGDGEVNIVTASAISAGFLIFDHLMMVLAADGTLVWQQTVADNTSSASGVAAQDLTGDGVWEILWNGATDGFLIIRGSDGKRLFNEPFTRSGTIMEYPSMGDVDGDGVADVVVAGREGIFVISHVGRWTDSRPKWNQHNYHVTNINDDWSVPFTQPNSWELHNTYRTQTPERNPTPAYQMVFTYTEGAPNVTVLTTTASVPLTGTPPTYSWSYRQEWYQPVIATTFDSLLTGLEPGETRQVSAGTEIMYRLPSGLNNLTLPALYVTVPSLGEITPAAQSVPAGGTAVFTLTLSHLGSGAALYSLFPAGLPADWLTYPESILLESGETAIVTITVSIPSGSEPDTLALWLDVVWETESDSGTISLEASLTVLEGVGLALSPAEQSGPTGQPLSYSLTVTNLESEARTYALTATGLAAVTLPAEIMVPGSSSETVQITATPHRAGPQPFTIEAKASNGAQGSVDGVVTGEGRLGVQVSLAPETAVTGPGSTAIYTANVTNAGDTADTYILQVDVPVGWSVQLMRGGIPVSDIAIPPFLFNSAELTLWVTPSATAQSGTYPISLTAQSLSQAETTATAVATAEVDARGVQVSISPSSQSVNPAAPATWDVTVTNTGSLADTYDLEVSGMPALAGTLGMATVSLVPGASQTVSLVAPDLSFLAPGRYVFAVRAQSQALNGIRAQDEAVFTVPSFEEVAVRWDPAGQIVSGTLSTDLRLIVSNTGNLITEYQLNFSGEGLTSLPSVQRVTVPPGREAAIQVEIRAARGGTYEVVGSAVAPTGTSASASASLIFDFDDGNQPPVVNAGPDQTVEVGQVVQFSGTATDADGDALVSFEWDFGDGDAASGSLTPTHIYTVAGTYLVTLTVTDERGATGTDSLQVQVMDEEPERDGARLYLPLIFRAP